MKGQDISEKELLYISSKIPLINVALLIINEFRGVFISWRDDEHCGKGEM